MRCGGRGWSSFLSASQTNLSYHLLFTLHITLFTSPWCRLSMHITFLRFEGFTFTVQMGHATAEAVLRAGMELVLFSFMGQYFFSPSFHFTRYTFYFSPSCRLAMHINFLWFEGFTSTVQMGHATAEAFLAACACTSSQARYCSVTSSRQGPKMNPFLFFLC